MTEKEKTQLRAYCESYTEDFKRRYPDIIIGDHTKLDEDSAQFYTSTVEIKVFHLKPDELHKLHTAFSLYELLIDIIHGHSFNKEVVALIEKARSICPPAHYFGQEFAFRTGYDNQQWFTWFASKFFDLPIRSSHAFWHKRSFNTSHLIGYKDEVTLEDFSKEDVVRIYNEASDIGPELIDEIYETLNHGGVAVVNSLFARKGTFNPDFKNRRAVIEFIALMKQFAGMNLTPEELAIASLKQSKN